MNYVRIAAIGSTFFVLMGGSALSQDESCERLAWECRNWGFGCARFDHWCTPAGPRRGDWGHGQHLYPPPPEPAPAPATEPPQPAPAPATAPVPQAAKPSPQPSATLPCPPETHKQ